MQREQRAEYRRRRDADALRRTRELDARVAALEGLLVAGCRSEPLTDGVAPFSPGDLGVPVVMPDQRFYQVRADFERDWYAAQAAEARRLEQLAAYRRQYEEWAAARRAEIGEQRPGPEDVVAFFSAVLSRSTVWPADFPRRVSAAYDRGTRRLVLDWELPGFEVVPAAKGVKYLPSTDQEKEVPRPVTQRRALYRDVLAQSVLLAVRELFVADRSGVLERVALNGYVAGVDPATGVPGRVCVASVAVDRPVFDGLNLALVSAVECVTGALSGRLSARPDERAAVQPFALPEQAGSGAVGHGDGDEPDLLAMDPIAFEGLVAQLFRARGLEAVTTQRSNDGGVDVRALDPDPISGGSIIVQVKRYRNTVPPSAVRDLFGTVQDAGANKGVLVTTSRFGPGSYTFASGKPLTLIPGAELVELLRQHGLRGRLGTGEPARAARGPVDADAGFNVLGMGWSGAVALDVCALVCAGSRVLGDEWFVFFNNPATPDGSVASVASVPAPALSAGDKAAVRVGFDALPAGADRLVLVAAVDPEVNSDADLAGFLDAGIVLRDGTGAELDRLEVSDGRAGETALVLGSFRRRAGGDWDFVVGGKGYRGGLAELVGDFGIEVE
ncbi:restriction endonuclease [Streptomyces sp. NPDC003943]